MKYAKLGNTDINVSKLCVGCMSYGVASEDFQPWTLNYEDSRDMIGYAYEKGVNFFDTANSYSHGTSEEFLGRAIRELGIARDKVVLASKVFFNEGKLSKVAILREIDGTLKRLDTDYLDLYIIHRYDHDTPIEETLEALDSLVKSGKVRALGASAMYEYQFHNMQECAEKNGWTKFSAMENHWNLLYREDEREMVPYCLETNVFLMPYSPLAGGHLTHIGWETKSQRSQTDKVLRSKYDGMKANNLEIVSRVDQVAKKLGVTMTEVSLAWLLAKGVSAPIVGATKKNHFDDAVKAVDLELSEEDMKYLEEAYVPHPINGILPR